MTGTENDITVVMIPVDRITVLNPRVRDRKKFLEIVDSIERVGLKQPIKVSRIDAPDAEAAYNLVYGQGRLEAFVALGQEDNSCDRDQPFGGRQPDPEPGRECGAPTLLSGGDASRDRTLSERGYSDTEIGLKIGYSFSYVGKIRRLLEAARNGCWLRLRPARCRSRSPWPSRLRMTSTFKRSCLRLGRHTV